jgi:hypothetical protein
MKVVFEVNNHAIPEVAAPFPMQARSMGAVKCADDYFGIDMHAMDGRPFAHGHYSREVMRDFAKRILALTEREPSP